MTAAAQSTQPTLPVPAGLILAQRPRVLLPGLLAADPGLERYRVRPGAVTALPLGTGDELAVIDVEGRQRGELTVFGSGGEDYRAFGTSADTTATVVRALAGQLALPSHGEPGQLAPPPVGALGQPRPRGAVWTGAAVASTLAARGLDPAQARAVALFGEWSPASTRVSFVAQQPVTCVVAAPGGLMSVDEHNPPSDLLIEVRRATGAAVSADGGRPEPELPPPLADPLLDLRVDKATAMAYEVKAGQFIQVIDVEGRQCSDFLAFNARRLADGAERGLDATTTRNLTGNAYPQPGLFGKFFDQDSARLLKWCVTPSAGTTLSRWPATPSTTRIWATRAM